MKPDQPEITLEEAETAYRQQVVETYQWLNFSGFERPDLSLTNVRLEDIFVRLALTKEIQKPVPSENSSQAGLRKSQQQEQVVTVQEPIELGQALSKHLLIVGDPGAGKSTLLHWVAVTFAQARQQEPDRLGPSADSDQLPLLVELGRLPDRYLKPGPTPNWLQLLPEYLTAQLAFTNTPPQLLARALADGRCLLLFDGLDEVADLQTRNRLARWLAELAQLLPGNRVVIGSRPAGVSANEGALGRQFQHCRIEPFTSEDVQRFFRFWYALDQSLTPTQQREGADSLFARVQAIPAILQLASTPLLATILVLIWRNQGDLPKRRVDLYEYCCRELIQRWEVSHDVAYQGVLANMDWEDHLQLLTPLAYAIHSHEQRTATREELVPLLAQALQSAGYVSEQVAASREAKRFLDALSLRSGLLQHMGKDENNDLYGFPHLTFQEYLAARYIAAQPDPEYIDPVMRHLHETWWQQVHVLTIAHLGSGKAGASKASELILTILHVYKRPWWILRSSKNRWLRENGPGKLLPQVQLERRIAWMLDRELELAVRGYAECTPNGTTKEVSDELKRRAKALVQQTLNDDARYATWETLLTIAGQLSDPVVRDTLQKARNNPDWEVQKRAKIILEKLEDREKVVSDLLAALRDTDGEEHRQTATSLGQAKVSHEEVVNRLLTDLRDPNSYVRLQAAGHLGYMGVGNQEVVRGLLAALRDPDKFVRRMVAESLGQVGIANQEVMDALLAALHDLGVSVRREAAESLVKMGVGNQIVISTLLVALHDPRVESSVTPGVLKERVWVQVAEILGRVGNQAGVDALLIALRGPDRNVRRQAAESLERVGTVNQAGVDALLIALRGPDRNVRQHNRLRARWGSLLAVLHDPNRDVRLRAAMSLGCIGVSNEEVARGLLAALYDPNRDVRHRAAVSLGCIGVSNEEMVRGLLAALRNPHWDMRDWAAACLGRLEIKEKIQLRRVLVALNGCLHDKDSSVRRTALISICQLLNGRTIPGHPWKSLQKRRARLLWLKRIAILAGAVTSLLLIALVVPLLNPNSLILRWVTWLSTLTSIIGVTVRDLWKRKQSK